MVKRRINHMMYDYGIGELTIWHKRREWQRMRWFNSIPDSMGMTLSKTLGDGEGQGSLACCSPWVTKSQTWVSDWTTTTVWHTELYLMSNLWWKRIWKRKKIISESLCCISETLELCVGGGGGIQSPDSRPLSWWCHLTTSISSMWFSL